MKVYVGVDPGKQGAIVVIADDGQLLEENRMPKTPHDILRLFEEIDSNYGATTVLFEKSQPMPADGKTQIATTMRSYGEMIGMCRALRLPFVEVTPATWKRKVIGTLKKGTPLATKKQKACQKAKEVFPDLNLRPGKCTKDQDGIAEAALIAEFGRRERL